MADKLTQLVLDALTRAAADPAGTPLFGTKAEAGLFPPTTPAKPAAKKCLDDGLLAVVTADPKKAGRDLVAATEKGLRHLLEQVSPKQVLEDFVRILEARQGQVDDLLAAARRMADGIAGLRAAVAAVLPQVVAVRVAVQPNPPAPFPGREGGASGGNRISPPLPLGEGVGGGVSAMNGVATLEAPAAADADELAGAAVAHLADWAASAAAGQDCPLPDLYRSLACRENPPTIGQFHDGLRALHHAGQVYLHPWTGPLYALPEPAYALLVGHEIAYYASIR